MITPKKCTSEMISDMTSEMISESIFEIISEIISEIAFPSFCSVLYIASITKGNAYKD